MSNQKYEQQRFRFPMLKGIVPIRRSQLPSEIMAGLTVAALAIPEVMGYTKIRERL